MTALAVLSKAALAGSIMTFDNGGVDKVTRTAEKSGIQYQLISDACGERTFDVQSKDENWKENLADLDNNCTATAELKKSEYGVMVVLVGAGESACACGDAEMNIVLPRTSYQTVPEDGDKPKPSKKEVKQGKQQDKQQDKKQDKQQDKKPETNANEACGDNTKMLCTSEKDEAKGDAKKPSNEKESDKKPNSEGNPVVAKLKAEIQALQGKAKAIQKELDKKRQQLAIISKNSKNAKTEKKQKDKK